MKKKKCRNIKKIKLEPLLTIIELSPRGPHMIPEGCTKQNTSKPRKTAKFKGPDEVRDTEEQAGKEPDGEIDDPAGPGASTSSGFGGLGFEGMVGIDDSVGEGAPTPGVGNNGSISGDKVGGENEGASFKNAGAADIVENCTCI